MSVQFNLMLFVFSLRLLFIINFSINILSQYPVDSFLKLHFTTEIVTVTY